MTALQEFLDAYDQAKDGEATQAIAQQAAAAGALDIGDAAIEQWAEAMAPYYDRLAERADLDVAELRDLMGQRARLIASICITRSLATKEPRREVHRALRDYACDAFLAGVAYQQQRDIPNLEETR